MVKTVIAAGGKVGAAPSLNFIVTDYKKFVDVHRREMKRIMQGVADIILEHTMPWVPLQYGGLRESARAFAGRTSQGYAAFVTFGGEDAPVEPTPNAPDGIVDYAPVVHEAVFPFLTTGAAEAQSDVDSYIVNELRKIKT